MTVYTDGTHLIADSENELHDFAKKIGLKREWYQDHRIGHYDITTARKLNTAISNGAIKVNTRELIKIYRREQKTCLCNCGLVLNYWTFDWERCPECNKEKQCL